jgi:hypothetical protein
MEAAMEACAHAAAGDAGQCHRALGDAAEAVALLTIDQDDPDWLDFDEGGYWGHAARAYRDLGELSKAGECAARSVGLCLPEHSRTRAQRTTIQATAHLLMGEIDAAAAAGDRVVHEAWNLHSGRVFGEVTELVAALAPLGATAASRFLDQARELLAARTGDRRNRRGLTSHDRLERLREPSVRQASGCRVGRDALAQPVRELVRVLDLAGVSPDGRHLAIEGAGDVHISG